MTDSTIPYEFSYKFAYTNTLPPQGKKYLLWPQMYRPSIWRILHIDRFEDSMIVSIESRIQ